MSGSKVSLLDQLTKDLISVGISTARIDATALLAHVTQSSKANVIAGNFELSTKQHTLLGKLVARRKTQEPLAYVLGQKEFYGRSFFVTKHTLIPRPESEAVISLALQLNLPLGSNVIDIGTGCGALGITYRLEIPKQRPGDKPDRATNVEPTGSRAWLHLNDISDQAIAVAKQNARSHKVCAQCLEQDFTKLKSLEHYDLVLANLPYVPADKQRKFESDTPGLIYEPELALYAAEDGLSLYRQLLGKKYKAGCYVIIEALIEQHDSLLDLAKSHSFELHSSDNLALCLKKLAS